MPKKPKDVDEYKRWLRDERRLDLKRLEVHYESVTRKVLSDVESSVGWKTITAHLVTMHQSYQVKTGYKLFTNPSEPLLLLKTFDSFLIKTFRKNVLGNERWPEAPTEGWILPQNWFIRVNDIVRTMLVVKYLDGVTFVADQIPKLLKAENIDCAVDLVAREEGYYAAHLYFHNDCNIPKPDWDTERVSVSIELQVTTQLQEVIRQLLHTYYEASRLGNRTGAALDWQWDYQSQEFAANYLGHVLHYIEGMIMDVREKQERRNHGKGMD